MPFGTLTNRNRLIAGSVFLLVIILVLVYSVIAFALRGKGGPQVGHHTLIETLSYCGAVENKLCIVDFSQEVDGGMQINFQTPYAFYPEFILKIIRNGEESSYECDRVEPTSTAVVCTGAPQVPGEVLEFRVISKNWGTVFAAGKFAIIGIALFTPAVEATGTLETPTEAPTGLPSMTPFPSTPTPTRTLPPTSYPNPSYP